MKKDNSLFPTLLLNAHSLTHARTHTRTHAAPDTPDGHTSSRGEGRLQGPSTCRSYPGPCTVVPRLRMEGRDVWCCAVGREDDATGTGRWQLMTKNVARRRNVTASLMWRALCAALPAGDVLLFLDGGEQNRGTECVPPLPGDVIPWPRSFLPDALRVCRSFPKVPQDPLSLGAHFNFFTLCRWFANSHFTQLVTRSSSLICTRTMAA